MKIATSMIALLMLSLMLIVLAGSCYAQGLSSAPYVGGDFGRAWLGNIDQLSAQPAKSTYSDLWNWGGGPKGSMAVNGYLVPDLRYIWKSENGTGYWAGWKYPYASGWYPAYNYPYSFSSIYPSNYYYPPDYLSSGYVARRLY